MLQTKLIEIDKFINDFIEDTSSVTFEEIALMIHTFQYQFSHFYRNFCLKNDIGEFIDDSDLVPFFNTELFKAELIPSVVNANKFEGMFFETSGTAHGNKTKIFRDIGYFKLRNKTIEIQGRLNWFKKYYPEKIQILFLDKANRRNQNDFREEFSVLNKIKHLFGADNSMFCNYESDFYEIINAINNSIHQQYPIVIIAPSYYLSKMITKMKSENIHFPIDNKIMVMDSGGLKNKGDHNNIIEYQEELFYHFCLTNKNYKNTYAMTEIGVQISDNDYGSKEIPKWAKIKIVDAQNLAANEGNIVIYDLLNRANLFGLKTSDIGIYENNSLKILGRSV